MISQWRSMYNLAVTWLVGAEKAEEENSPFKVFEFLAAFYVETRSDNIVATKVPLNSIDGIGQAEEKS